MAVPITGSKVSDIKTDIEAATTAQLTVTSLKDAIDNDAVVNGYDPTYVVGAYNSLQDFRNYTHPTGAFSFDTETIIITFNFSSPGQDLDLRVTMTDPVVGGTMGWCKNANWPTTAPYIMRWGGDNTGTGVETVLVDVNEFKTAYPAEASFSIDLRCFWYNTPTTNPVEISAWLYKGGTISGPTAFAWVNTGSTDSLQLLSETRVITLQSRLCANVGTTVGILNYNVNTFEGDLVLPDDVTNPTIGTLSTSTVTGSSILLTWTAASDNVAVAGYYIYQGSVNVQNLTNGAATSYNVTSLGDHTLYNFHIFAYDAVGNISASSNVVSATTLDITAPSIPTGLSAASITQTTFTLNWSASTDGVAVTGYKVYDDGVLYSDVGNVLTKAVTGRVVGSSTWTVRAYDAAANLSNSSTGLVVTHPDTTAPSAPTSLSSSAITDTTFTLTWVAPSDNVAVTGYKIYDDGVQQYDTGTTAVSKAITGETAGATSTWTVRAYDAAANLSAASTGLSVTQTSADVIPPTTPGTPTLSADPSTTTANITWTASTDNIAVTGYDIYRDGVAHTTSTTLSNNVTFSPTGGDNTFTVRAKDAAGNTSAFTAGLPVYANPNALVIAYASSTETEVNIDWPAHVTNAGIDRAEIYVDGVLKKTETTFTDAQTTSNIAQLFAGTTYLVKIRVWNTDYVVKGAWSNEVSCLTQGTAPTT